ncbi:MAG: hypothetical protein PHQ34_10675 [Methanothrix sp.]|nr:hypothetical protein [Methanothrix sp.]
MMKRIIVILLILLAANFIAAAALSSQPGFAGITRPANDVVSTPGTDVKKVEDKMADALAKMDSWKKVQAREKIEPSAGSTGQVESSSSPSPGSTESNSTEFNPIDGNSTGANLTSPNSTSDNSSINSPTISPPDNSSRSLDSSSGDNGADAGKVDASEATVLADQKIGSSSEGRFKGYYGMTAARHEIGKSGINSHMFLSGEFQMDKAVKFQDQGID